MAEPSAVPAGAPDDGGADTDGEAPPVPAASPSRAPLFASSNTKELGLDDASEGEFNMIGLNSDKEIDLVESYFPGTTHSNMAKRRTMMSERSDAFSYLSVQQSVDHERVHGSMQHALPPLLVFFACLVAAFLGLVVAGLHLMIKWVGCPLGINGCNSFAGEKYEEKGNLLQKALEGYVPEDVIFVVMASVCCLTIGIIADLVPANYEKQILGGGTVQSLLAVAAGVPIPFRAALLRVLVMALYFLGGGTMGGDGPTIQVCTSLACMIGWTCGIRAPRTQSLLASLGFCCGFASSFNAPLSGILFAMEELSHVSSRLTTRVICIILIGSIVSTAVMRGFLANKTLFQATHSEDLESMVSGGSIHDVLGQDMWMLISVVIGFIAALMGFLFSKAFDLVHKFLKWVLTWMPRWLMFALIGGLVAGIGSGVYRATGLKGVWGIGVNSLKDALEQDFRGHAGYLSIFALGKLVAFLFSVAARFPGDTLEPVLIGGAFLGGAIGKHLPKDVVGDSYAPCVIFGMVGLFASCFRFPLTPVVIVLELTGTRTYNIILPVALSSFTALAVSNHLFPPILEQILHQDDIDLEAVAELAELAEEEEEIMQQLNMQKASSMQSQSYVSEASVISAGGALGGLVNRLEETMMDVSGRRRRTSQTSHASSRSGRVGRGIRRLSMNSRMSAVSRGSTHGSGDRSGSPRTRSPRISRSHRQHSADTPAKEVCQPPKSSPVECVTEVDPSDVVMENDVPVEYPNAGGGANQEIEEIEANCVHPCCEPFGKDN